MGFLGIFFNAKFFTVGLSIFENEFVFMTLKPSILPVKQNWLRKGLDIVCLAWVKGALLLAIGPHAVRTHKNKTEDATQAIIFISQITLQNQIYQYFINPFLIIQYFNQLKLRIYSLDHIYRVLNGYIKL